MPENTPIIVRVIEEVKNKIFFNSKFKSKKYWENRYKSNGTSGVGSYGRLAIFKERIINQYIEKHSLENILELGCGDGSQLSLAKYKQYMGFDVSKTAISLCKKKFKEDKSKIFHVYNKSKYKKQINSFNPDVVISLDVIYHLVENEIFNEYMSNLFDSNSEHVIIYSDNGELDIEVDHVKNRKFTQWIEEYRPTWRLGYIVKNEYRWNNNNKNETSFSDFYFYQKNFSTNDNVDSHAG